VVPTAYKNNRGAYRTNIVSIPTYRANQANTQNSDNGQNDTASEDVKTRDINLNEDLGLLDAWKISALLELLSKENPFEVSTKAFI